MHSVLCPWFFLVPFNDSSAKMWVWYAELDAAVFKVAVVFPLPTPRLPVGPEGGSGLSVSFKSLVLLAGSGGV